ncbi:MAG: prohibitin family protein [Clostridia bacterium]|nr:prohibitin family protein [Clostridia bacterium]
MSTYRYSANGAKFTPKRIITLVAIGVAAILLIVLGFNCFAEVPTGHTGILTTFGKVEDQTLESGMHFKLPWQKVVNMDNRNQKSTLTLTCFSSDIQEVDVVYAVNYQIEKSNAQNIYKSIGTDYFKTVMDPRIQEAVKKQVAQYDAESLIDSRQKLSDEIYQSLVTDLASYNIELVSASIENIDFTDAFTAAVEAKQVAAQNKLKAETEQEQANMEAEKAAERAKIEAQAKADAAKIAAEAEAEVAKTKANAEAEVTKIAADAEKYRKEQEAAANKLLSESMTEELLQYFYIQGWDGKLPETWVSQEDFMTILDIAKQQANSAE